MAKLDSVSADDLRGALDAADGRKQLLRLVVTLNYKHGVDVDDIAAMYGVPGRTVYNWLDRFEGASVAAAVRDESRPGRPSRLDAADRRRLADHLARSPADAGYDAAVWTPSLVRQHVERSFGVAYSRRHARRLLDELGSATSGDDSSAE